MAIDTATKRFSALGVPLGLGVTPDATPDEYWRASAGWWYSIGETAVSLILDMPLQDDAASTAVDDVSASNNNGTLTGDTEDISTTGPGLNLLLAFDVTPFEAGVALSTPITFTPTDTGCIQFFARRLNSASNNDGVFADFVGGTTDIRFPAGGDSIEIRESGVTALTLATGVDTELWHHYAIALAVDGTASLYVDGALVGAFSGTRAEDVVIDTLLVDIGSAWLQGAAAGFRIYDTARTLEQIQADMGEGLSGLIAVDSMGMFGFFGLED